MGMHTTAKPLRRCGENMGKRASLAGLATIALFLADLLGSRTYAQTYYVDWDSGADKVSCGSTASPCKTPWGSQLKSQVLYGDTVIISAKKDGTHYFNNDNGDWKGGTIIDASQAGVTWKAAPGQTVKLGITATWMDTNYTNEGMPVIGIGAHDVVIDGFATSGQIFVGGDNSRIENCDLSNGNSGIDRFMAVLYYHGSWDPNTHYPTDWVVGGVIRNTRLHHNFNNGLENSGNHPLIMFYSSKGQIIENCEFYNGTGTAIFIKDNQSGQVIRNNFFHNMPVGIVGNAQYGGSTTDFTNVNIYNNVFSNLSMTAVNPNGAGLGSSFVIYNNTFFNCAQDVGRYQVIWDKVHEFNNIHYHTSGSQYYLWEDSPSLFSISKYLFLDYNLYYTNAGASWKLTGRSGSPWASLPAWRSMLTGIGCLAGSTCEVSSVETNPNFNPDDGVLNGDNASDFKRSSYIAVGRGGAWPTVMGAYVTGQETIGVDYGTILPPSTSLIPRAPTSIFVN